MTNLYLWLAAGAGLVVLYSARQRVLRKIGRFLLVNDAPPRCDAIVLLNGNISTRTYRAAALRQQATGEDGSGNAAGGETGRRS